MNFLRAMLAATVATLFPETVASWRARREARAKQHATGGLCEPQPPPYAPGHPSTCPGCALAVHAVNNGHRGVLCPDLRCGQWWTTAVHAHLYRANVNFVNPESRH